MGDENTTDTPLPKPDLLAADPAAMKEAHAKYGDYLKKVGLPFEPEEFDDSTPSAAAEEAALEAVPDLENEDESAPEDPDKS